MRPVAFVCIFTLSACGGSGDSSSNLPTDTPPPVDTPSEPPSQEEPPSPPPVNIGDFVVSVESILSADGPNNGQTAFELIQDKFGQGSIEAPDFYPNDHQGVTHIIEENDAIVGDHFVFLSHRDLDFDRGVQGDRQRNEIKTFDRSDPDLLAYEGETFQYQWKFKVSSELELSSRFTHFFQIKARNASPDSQDNLNGNDNQPVLTISGAERNSTGNLLQVRHSRGNNPDGTRREDQYLQEIDWQSITDEWLEVFVQITFAEAENRGALQLTLTRMSDQNTLIDINESAIDMWRGQTQEDFSRPKWGIYRSTADAMSLRPDEEKVHFADFVIRKGNLQE